MHKSNYIFLTKIYTNIIIIKFISQGIPRNNKINEILYKSTTYMCSLMKTFSKLGTNFSVCNKTNFYIYNFESSVCNFET